MAALLIKTRQYQRASLAYEELANASASGDGAARFTTRDHVFKASLCRLADLEGCEFEECKHLIQRYSVLDSGYATTREAKLVGQLVEAIEKDEPEAFTAAIEQYEKVCGLDDWKVALLMEVRKRLEVQPDLT